MPTSIRCKRGEYLQTRNAKTTRLDLPSFYPPRSPGDKAERFTAIEVLWEKFDVARGGLILILFFAPVLLALRSFQKVFSLIWRARILHSIGQDFSTASILKRKCLKVYPISFLVNLNSENSSKIKHVEIYCNTNIRGRVWHRRLTRSSDDLKWWDLNVFY